MGPEAANAASEATAGLKSIGDIVKEIQSVNPGLGYDYGRFPTPRWERDYSLAQKALTMLASQPSIAPESLIDVYISDERLYLASVGEGDAVDVDITFHPRERQCESPLVRGDSDEKLPIKRLAPGESCPLMLGLSSGCYPPFDVCVSWTDAACTVGERRELRKTVYEA